jgi:peptidoglycan/LPS O-acetylase OafA/YrhL
VTSAPTAAQSRVAPEPASGTPAGRERGLDGLRGVAALVVVVHHLLLVVPGLAALLDVDGRGARSPEAASAEWWLFRTPLRLVWAGHEAVLLFFVLSGLVLTLPVLASVRPDWRRYYPRRLVRLYVPVWASLVLAVGLALLVQRDLTADSSWLAIHRPPSVRALALDTTLLFGSSNLNSPLWSLRWEIWFSLLLPVAVWLVTAVRSHRWWPVTVVGLAGLSSAAQLPALRDALPAADLTVGLLTYLPVFGIGVVLARVSGTLRVLADGVQQGRRPRTTWAVLAGLALVLVPCETYVDPATVPTAVPLLLRTAALLGVAGLVVLALVWPAARRQLARRPLQWLGSRSFSLYLVHESLLVAAALLLGGPSVAVWGMAALPVLALALLVAEFFHRCVERPAHRLARSLGCPPAGPAGVA